MARQPYTEVVEDPLLDERMGSSAEREVVTEEAEEDAVVVERPRRPWWYFGGTDMPKRIMTIVVVVLLIVLLVYVYRRFYGAPMGNGEVVVDDTSPRVVPETPPPSRPQPAPKPIERAAEATAAAVKTVATTVTAPSAPASDSINPNPPNGGIFSGTGKFQVYRQGNLTWRVDTDTGHTCILFATEDEWRKQIVYSHGCNNS